MNARMHKRTGTKRSPTDIGNLAEYAALQFLLRQGLRELKTNYHCRYGEIDIIASSGTEIIFVEVRFRSSPSFGGAAASVTRTKQKKLIKTANHYLQYRAANVQCRFDVLDVTPLAGKNSESVAEPFQFYWIKSAFM